MSQAHGTFAPLPAVAQELHGIILVLSGAIKLDKDFTSDTMFMALEQRYPVVHIASHFHLHPGNNTESFLLLGDGSRLSLAQLKAKPTLFHGVDLLTLSACDTAMGDIKATGKEIDGFAMQAQLQGAKAVMASLWPVADDSTKDLMQTFYRLRESQPGVPKVEALRRAQLALLHGQVPSTPGPQVAALGESQPAGDASTVSERGNLKPLQPADGDVQRSHALCRPSRRPMRTRITGRRSS